MTFLRENNFFQNEDFNKYFDENNYVNYSFSKYRKVYESKNKITKIARKNNLKREILGLEILGKRNLAPKLIANFTHNEFDVIVMEKLDGINLIDDKYLEKPEIFIEKYAKSLYNLHHRINYKIDLDKFEFEKLEQVKFEFIKKIDELYKNNNIDLFMLEKNYKISVEEAIKYVKKNYHKLSLNNLIHGDCCLPNIIFKEDEFYRFIDLDLFGIFDYHYDLFWAIWTLEFNLGSDNPMLKKYRDIFIKSYGKELIDKERLKICGLISCLTGEKDLEKLK